MTSERPEALDGVHEAFLAEPDAPLPDLVRPVVADSWRRSLRLGVDPVAHAPIEFNDSSLAAYRDAHPLAPLMPLVRSLLAEDAEEAGHIVAVGDAQGRLLWVEGHRGLRGRAESMHFVAGALWSEGGAGTNAPGTALATRKAVQIAASEHFGLQVHPWSCVAAPVRDPLSGELLGVVDLTGGAELAGPRSLALVRACASAMESQLLAAARERAAWESSRPTVIGVPRRPVEQPDALRAARQAAKVAARPATLSLLGRDGAVLDVGGRATTLSPRHSEMLWLLARHPLGLSGQGIDVALHERGEHLVTIRAELVRLRRVLAEAFGSDALASKPYRLVVGLTTDLEEVRRLLARGAVVKAVDAFSGPPLPGSTAPAVVAAREEVVAELREAVLRSRSAAALERWTASGSGHDDAAAWQLLEQVLPYGSPKRSTARAHLRRLAQA
jgi:transcriptional regulator of acetoin/glycerol metabolism